MRALAVALGALVGCSFNEGGPGAIAEIDGGNQRIDAGKSVIDAAGPPDARPDATPVDCDGDDDCATPPSPCFLPGTCNRGRGVCEFGAVDCSGLDGECTQGACDPGNGSCVALPANAGGACGPGLGACGDFTACGDFGDPFCDESGTRTRSCADNICLDGQCSVMPYTETEDCSRETDGVTCQSTECGPFSCAGFGSTCDETGTQSRACTEFKCMASACAPRNFMQSEPCSRDTDGLTCNPPTCGTPSPCGGFTSTCDENGSQTRSCTPHRCGGGNCNPGAPFTETLSCSRDTDGMICSAMCTGEMCVEFCCDGGDCPVTPIGGNCPD